jgi:hypothetical protein
MQCPAKLLVDRLKRGVWQRATPIRKAAGALAEANSASERGYSGAFGATLDTRDRRDYVRVRVADSVPRSPNPNVSGVPNGTSTAPQYEPVVTIMPVRSGVLPDAR